MMPVYIPQFVYYRLAENEFKLEEIIKLKAHGMPLEEIAKIIGLSMEALMKL